MAPITLHRKSQSIAEAHVPTLKALGKSDCEVKIVSILECENLVSLDALYDHSSGLDAMAMQQVLDDARSPSPNPLHDNPFSLMGSRAAQVQKASRRPVLAYRPITEPLRLSPHSGHLSSPRRYLTDATFRRLTSNKWAVRKQAFLGGMQDGSRLLKQIRKQIILSAVCRKNPMNATISTPEIYGLRVPHAGDARNDIVVDMEYIPFQDVRHIMLEHDKAINEWLIESAISVVDYELTQTTMVTLKAVLPDFHSKAESIKRALPKASLGARLDEAEIRIITEQIDQLLGHFDALPDLQVPLGTCHGDLTFQNMLVDPVNRELCVFDFLDSFVESPLQDIAKLLQDCRHHWFLTQIQIPDKGIARVVTTLGVFYDRIYSAYYRYAFWDVVPLFECFCLARILPYMTTPTEKKCIMVGMQRITEDIGLSCAKLEGDSSTRSGSLSNGEDGSESEIMTTVIVSALGEGMAEPYADGQIKLLAVNSSGRHLIVDSLSSLDFRSASTIIVAVSEALILHHSSSKSAFEALFSSLSPSTVSKLRFYYAVNPTIDAVETVTTIISALSITGPIFIKDADNGFAHSVDVGNYLTYLSIVKEQDPLTPAPEWNGRPDLIDATKKSYVSFSYDNIVSNVAYCSFVSSQFCCGGWSFVSAEDFVAAATKLRDSIQFGDFGAANGKGSSPRGNLKVLDILWQLVCDGHLFFGAKVSKYEDWGSREAWEAYARTPLKEVRENGDGVNGLTVGSV